MTLEQINGGGKELKSASLVSFFSHWPEIQQNETTYQMKVVGGKENFLTSLPLGLYPTREKLLFVLLEDIFTMKGCIVWGKLSKSENLSFTLAFTCTHVC